jgi:HEXXH motif-containing protein
MSLAGTVPSLTGDNGWIVAEQLARRRRWFVALFLVLEQSSLFDATARAACECVLAMPRARQDQLVWHPAFTILQRQAMAAHVENRALPDLGARVWLMALPAALAAEPALSTRFALPGGGLAKLPLAGVGVRAERGRPLAVEVGGGVVSFASGGRVIAELPADWLADRAAGVDRRMPGAAAAWVDPLLPPSTCLLDATTPEYAALLADTAVLDAHVRDDISEEIEPIAEAQVAAAADDFAEALRMIQAASPTDLDDLGAFTRAVVPFRGTGFDSFTRNDCPGALFIHWRPGDVWWNAEHLVHENGHARLTAIQEVCPLWLNPPDAVYPSPWRRDPRPIEGLCQAVYVFYLTAAWLARSIARFPDAEPRLLPYLRKQLAKLAQGEGVIREHAQLSDTGRAFFGELEAAIARLRGVWSAA